MTSPAPTTRPGADEVPRSAWLALAVAQLATFLAVIDISAVNVAFPSIVEEFDTSRTTVGWVVSGYSVTVGALLLAAGRLADSHGRRRVFLPGVALFGLGSALCAVSPSVWTLIAARVVQATGGAVVIASAFAVVLPDFPPSRRSTAIGFAGATGALGAVVGPALGSVLIDASGWRAIFWINVPLCALVLFLGPRFLRESRDPRATGAIDGIGMLLGTLAVGLLMAGIVQSETWGLGDPRVIGLAVVGLALFPAVIRRSRSHPEALLDLDLFGYRSFASANLGVVFYGFAFGAGALVNSLVLQDLWGQPLSTVGLAFVPAPLLAAMISPISGSLADRLGHRWVLAIGCGLCALCYGAYAVVLGAEPQVWSRYVPISLIAGIGIGMTVATWTSAGLADIPPDSFGVAGATTNTTRQAATALGISVALTLVALGASELDPTGYRWAWWWITASYVLAAGAVLATFPAGNAADRAPLTGGPPPSPPARPGPTGPR